MEGQAGRRQRVGKVDSRQAGRKMLRNLRHQYVNQLFYPVIRSGRQEGRQAPDLRSGRQAIFRFHTYNARQAAEKWNAGTSTEGVQAEHDFHLNKLR